MQGGRKGLLNMAAVCKIIGAYYKKTYDLNCVWRWIALEVREVVVPLYASVVFTSGHSVTAGDRLAKGAAFRELQQKRLWGGRGDLGWDSLWANPICIYWQAKGVHPCSYCRVAGIL